MYLSLNIQAFVALHEVITCQNDDQKQTRLIFQCQSVHFFAASRSLSQWIIEDEQDSTCLAKFKPCIAMLQFIVVDSCLSRFRPDVAFYRTFLSRWLIERLVGR
jgi:hypothetical protein